MSLPAVSLVAFEIFLAFYFVIRKAALLIGFSSSVQSPAPHLHTFLSLLQSGVPILPQDRSSQEPSAPCWVPDVFHIPAMSLLLQLTLGFLSSSRNFLSSFFRLFSLSTFSLCLKLSSCFSVSFLPSPPFAYSQFARFPGVSTWASLSSQSVHKPWANPLSPGVLHHLSMVVLKVASPQVSSPSPAILCSFRANVEQSSASALPLRSLPQATPSPSPRLLRQECQSHPDFSLCPRTSITLQILPTPPFKCTFLSPTSWPLP